MNTDNALLKIFVKIYTSNKDTSVPAVPISHVTSCLH